MLGFAKLFRPLLAFGIAALASASSAYGADAGRWAKLTNPVFTHVVRDSELPATSGANTITEDGDGFIWVGMQIGLARWDGHHFRVFQPNAEIPGALPDSYINVLHTDSQGRLWIGTNSAGLARYDSAGDRFITYPAGANGLSHFNVNAIIDDGAGGLWVGTRGGLDHLDPVSGQVRHLRHDANDPTSLPSNRVIALRRDRTDTLWVGTAGGLARMDQGTSGFVMVPLPFRSGETSYVLSLFEDSEGRMWVGTRGQGVHVIDPRNGAVREVTADPLISLGDETVRALAEIRPGVIWIGTDSNGIVEVDASTATQTRKIAHDPTLPTSLGDGAIYVVYRDRSGLAWVGTDRSFSRHDVQTAVSTVFGATSRTDGVTDPDVNTVLEMPDGRVWLGLGEGIDVVDPHGVRVASLRPDPEQPQRALPRAYVTGLVRIDPHVYIATRKGVYRADSAARSVVRLSIPGRPDADDVATLLLDDGVLWVAGKLGLHALDISGGNDTRIQFGGAAQLSDQRINVLAHGPGGSFWVGTENGLDRIDFATRTVEHVLSAGDRQGGSLGLITAVLTDRAGRLWVGSYGSGISVMQVSDRGTTTLVQRLGVANGLRNSNVNQLLADASGRIWASTDDGIAVVDPVTFAVQMLDSADGAAIRSYWGGSGGTTAAGELLFGGVGGLTIVRPDQVKPWGYRPPIVVTGARIGGKPVLANRFNSHAAANPLIVTPEANSLAVEFAALDYSAPERTRYAYRLDGYDSDWVEADPNQRVAAYTNLSPGNYTLKLRGSNRNGEWTGKALSMPIRVTPAWFQTNGFRAFVVLAALALFLGLIHARTAYLRHRQRALERQIADRTASLKLRTEELQESQRQLEQI
ncbi:MAG TPA: two-component regulator propeller domain-containing protein, partial [Povalibacter sp.]